MILKLINIDEWSSKLKAVKSPKIFENGRFAKTGLFSQQIFGPLKSYCCACNRSTYRGRNYGKMKCPDCGVPITSTSMRRDVFAKIELPFDILNPIFYFLITEMKPSVTSILNDMIEYKMAYYINEKGFICPYDEESDSEKEKLIGLDGVLTYVNHLTKDNKEPISIFIQNNIKNITVRNIIVIPPGFRPCNKNSTGTYITDEINRIYMNIIHRSNQIKDIPVSYEQEEELYHTNFKNLQKSSIDLYKHILDKLSKKQGLIRANILGKRVDFSGRSVISPDPTLNINECRIPYKMVLEMFKPQLTTYLVNRRIGKRYNAVVKMIDDCIKNNDTSLFDIITDFCEDKICVLNRQPTLHRLGILGFKISPHLGNTIKIHPLACSPYNADFDGDAMAIYIPVTQESYIDITSKIMVNKNLINPANGEIVTEPNQDIVLGIYTLTEDDTPEVECKGKMISRGRAVFNSCLPSNYPLIDRIVTKKYLKIILNTIVDQYDSTILMNTLDKIKTVGFKASTTCGYTLSITDLYNQRLQEIANDLVGDYDTDINMIRTNKELDGILKKMPFVPYIESGARGSWDQARQLIFTRGYVADSTNKIRPDIIRSSLVRGLNEQEYFHSCYGSRKGLLDTAVSTSESGYLTRQLIYATHFVELVSDEDIKNKKVKCDCGSKDYLKIELKVLDDKDDPTSINESKSLDFIRSLVGRYYKIKKSEKLKKINDDIDEMKSLIGKTILLRSPIYCKSDKICHICYGDTFKHINSDQIGMVATQSLGERMTQLVLRTFHLSGVVQTTGSESKGQNEDIISGMGLVKQILHKPTSVCKPETPEKLVYALYKLFSQYGKIYLVHFEVIVSAMIWSNTDLWRTIKDRDQVDKKWVSILKVPSMHSWLIGCAFSNLKSELLNGLVKSREDKQSSISSLFRY